MLTALEVRNAKARIKPYKLALLNLSLVEAMQRLLSLALDKVRATGVVAESAVLAIVDAVMVFAVDMLQTGKRLAHVKNLIPAS